MKTSLKDWPKVYQKIRSVRGLSIKEKVLIAQGIAATPQERWDLHSQFLRLYGLYSHWERRRLGFKL